MLPTHIHKFLLERLKYHDTLNYLEIGVFDGENIDILSNSFKNKHFFGIDPFIEDGHTSHITNIEKGNNLISLKSICNERFKNKENVTLIETDSTNFNNNLTSEDIQRLNVNVVLIDGDHNHPHVTNDIDLALKLIGNKNGTFIMDDTNLKDVKESVQYALKVSQDRLLNMSYLDSNCFIFEIK